jgi:hypothetical protein
MKNLGFKQLSAENWLVPDDVIHGFVRIAPDGSVHDISGEEWLRDILQPQLSDSAPIEIRKLFEVARGTIAYGFFFYPIYTLGIEQLFRVVESAVTFKCNVMRAPSKIHSFQQKVDWLTEKSIIPQSECLRWKAVRALRNISSHPEMQSIYTPTDALTTIETIASDINFLFGGPH